jgi:GNAT superfamily N-acetyltransferase
VEDNIRIIEKPDFVSWDDIHEVLWEAHAENRENGINMPFPALPGEKIREKIEGGHGKMFVAMLDDRVVGTGAILIENKSFWWGENTYAYCCFGSVLPEFRGHGIYKEIELRQEEETKANGLEIMLFETHERNKRMLTISKKNGYKAIEFIVFDYYNIAMAKWLNGCPYSDWYLACRFHVYKLYRKLRYKPGGVKRFGL